MAIHRQRIGQRRAAEFHPIQGLTVVGTDRGQIPLGLRAVGRLVLHDQDAALLGQKNAFTVALGDAPNDIEMLDTADRGFIIANPHGSQIPHLAAEDEKRVTRALESGPTGWNTAVLSILSENTNADGD